MDEQKSNQKNGDVFDMPRKRTVRPVVVVLAVLLVACVGAGVAGGAYLINTYTQIKDVQNAQNIVPQLPSSASDAAQQAGADQQVGKIDFTALSQANPDIYGWVYIPGTNVNYPVCQNAEDNAYYLTHGADGKESEVGAIFSEAQFNHKDFQDPVCVLYGHNGYGSTMFSDLHSYELSDYWADHDKIYIYEPGHTYTYQVFSSFTAGDRHIMDAFNFQTQEGVQQFVDFAKKPGSIDAQVSDLEIKEGSKILVLSTCNTGALESVGRYIVCGVMIDDELTA